MTPAQKERELVELVTGVARSAVRVVEALAVDCAKRELNATATALGGLSLRLNLILAFAEKEIRNSDAP